VTLDKPVLLVEDDENDERFALLGLRRAGIQARVEVARDGEQAIEAIERSRSSGFALILLDLKLPRISGHDVLAHVRSTFGDDAPAVVVFTSSDEPIDIERCYKLGASEFVTKPIEFEAYLAAMRRIVVSWLN
jgi:CheY-like chemotaxis protein